MALFHPMSGEILISVEIDLLYWISRTTLSPIYQILFYPLPTLLSCYMETRYAQIKIN
uniref:Uncharacterized protein n=1 Tax=Arundo donax TaxID=35708 RepID=A0A0A8Y7G9_ARUDO